MSGSGIEGLRVAYFGYHNAGAGCLDFLIEAGARVPLVVTNSAYPGEAVWYRSVAETARGHGLRCLQAEAMDAAAVAAAVASARPDVVLSVAFRRMLPAAVLEMPRLGAFNLHDSLLPRYRGFTPSTWTIINGETETGVTLHALGPRPDTGPIAAQARVPIEPEDTGQALGLKLAAASQALLRSSLPRIAAGGVELTPQDENQATYFPRRGVNPDDDRIDWTLPAARISDLVRAVTHPLPGAFTDWRGQRLPVWRCRPDDGPGIDQRRLAPGAVAMVQADGTLVCAGDGLIHLDRVQPGDGAHRPLPAGAVGLMPGEILGGGPGNRLAVNAR